jgi:putative hydrolase of the HAD superfamily
MTKIISFDLDGTLVTPDFVETVWLRKIPQLYAIKNNISFDEALKIVEKEYFKVGPERLEWYNIHFWLKKFKISISWKNILMSCINRLKLYPEVIGVLENLNEYYRLIITSNAAVEFIETEMDTLKIDSYFDHIFSAVSDFKKTKKNEEVFELICNKIRVKKNEIIHIGDNYEFDYQTPKRLGIKAFLVIRDACSSDKSYIVRNLKDFEKKLRR